MSVQPELASKPTPKPKPYPFWLGGVAASIAASITHPLDLTKVRLQASGDKGMVQSLKKTVQTAGARGLFDGISGTWMRQMSYSLCRFWAYDESKKYLGAGKNAPAYKLALAGSMAGGIAGLVGNPAEIIMVRMQADYAKPPEKRLNYKHCFDGLFRMVREEGPSSLLRGVTPNVFRAILMNASQLASQDPYVPQTASRLTPHSPIPPNLRVAQHSGVVDSRGPRIMVMGLSWSGRYLRRVSGLKMAPFSNYTQGNLGIYAMIGTAEDLSATCEYDGYGERSPSGAAGGPGVGRSDWGWENIFSGEVGTWDVCVYHDATTPRYIINHEGTYLGKSSFLPSMWRMFGCLDPSARDTLGSGLSRLIQGKGGA
ncbi:mitochondrial carrier domain-containing protein [Hysterangium stoloniferum]|nr:mitochondrial carrier domain-containing protein [Hysterangium stoloniferum]